MKTKNQCNLSSIYNHTIKKFKEEVLQTKSNLCVQSLHVGGYRGYSRVITFNKHRLYDLGETGGYSGRRPEF